MASSSNGHNGQQAPRLPLLANPPQYRFPAHRIRPQRDHDRTPLVLVACGSFSPPTFLHLRLFAVARDFVRFNTDFEVVAGYLSPVSDGYQKAGLAPANHRLEMCRIAVDDTLDPDNYLMVDGWEATQPDYVPTAQVLDHFEHEINLVMGGVPVESHDGSDADTPPRRPARIMLLAGADLIQTMSTPVWTPLDLAHIFDNFGTMVVERAGTDLNAALESLDKWRSRGRIVVVPQVVQNDISSTKVRNFLKKDMSVRYLLPEPVIEYIVRQNLYVEDGIAGRGAVTSATAPTPPQATVTVADGAPAAEGTDGV